ncbi:MAG TPA: ThuA domain-containing protein [Gemmataceae bacterium]|nr:ThuA domain-containing protein [Gemmataceae bacterium]
MKLPHLRFAPAALAAIVLTISTVACAAPKESPADKEVPPDRIKKIEAALPEKAPAKPKKPRKVLIFTLATGYVHASIPTGAKALELMGKKTGAYDVVVSRDSAVFDPDRLKEFDAIVMVSTTGELFGAKGSQKAGTEEQARAERRRQSLLEFVAGGRGLVGIHAASDSSYQWPAYGQLIGGYFNGHPWGKITMKIDDPKNPVNACFGGKEYTIQDEIYTFKAPYSRDKLRVLTSIDLEKSGIKKGNRADNDYAVSWIHKSGKGRVFYCSLGHRDETFWNPVILKHYLAGIQFALGDLPADAAPSRKTKTAAGDKPKKKAGKPDTFTSAAAAGADYRIQGEYQGETAGKGKLGAQVVALGDGKFDVYLLDGGLPGAGWDKKGRRKLPAKTEGDKTAFAAERWSGAIAGDRLTGKTPEGTAFTLVRVQRKSATLGAKPPEGAIVLFNGKNADAWAGGKVVEEDLLFCGTQSKKGIAAGKLHIEFRTPFQPKARGQGRGNSGVYVQGVEVQVLDSFGLEGKNNECGAFYGRQKPSVNMCYPPLAWQTYDIEIKTGDKGDTVANVWHNGVKVHENVVLRKDAPKPTPVNLQNHGNPVAYCNIWFVESR